MIFIMDNGRIYSDHQITFYDIGIPAGKDVKEVGKALVALDALPFMSGDKPFVIGVANSVDWWQGSTISVTTQVVKEALDDAVGYWDEDEIVHYKEEMTALRELFG